MSRMPDEYYTALETRLRDLGPAVDHQCGAEVGRWYTEYLDAGEYGLAVEVAAEKLIPGNRGSSSLAGRLLEEARRMNVDEAFIELLTQAVNDPFEN